ncbi:MAG: hypothetical protein KGI28_03440 [Thaumarchaeota archaeon]|nr:hypothetical protein [Nitrososphaerota archaeon]
MSEDLISAIQQLLILGKGDQGRLENLVEILQKGKSLHDSDMQYLKMMIPLYLGSKEQESYQKNTENAIEQLHNEINHLRQQIDKTQRSGFEKYVGRKAVLFFVTVFVGWNALQSYIQTMLSDIIPSSVMQYVFPLNLLANYLDYGQVVWFGFLLLLISWPFIGAIHIAKFIKSRKISINSN